MKYENQKTGYEKTLILFVISLAITFMALGLNVAKTPSISKIPTKIIKDSLASVTAFKKVYRVLMSPRCMNCHPAGDIPLQGDDSHLHTMSPKRGSEGKGLYAMKCANCHQPGNSPGLHTPPGNPNWHLPPANMKMIFQGRSPDQLARQIVDKKQNGHKNLQQLIEHADDGLVLSAWNPGEGRTKPPLSHSEFKRAWIEWLNKGGYAPKKL
ncbi:hypothetical protein ASE74_16300 [Pedobacter sp. Leaf216]|uniref:c-type cytochrome n=1 Tax=Pedobacter sp. Leaf216 TaxID=1735684 RepID=UPI00070053D1|nr:hypothetical protein [Pedobacter sp. Leaf216]KQM77954.1 hypothetical protein ASE74_16300 [Pedobacter sp. Leaf216]